MPSLGIAMVGLIGIIVLDFLLIYVFRLGVAGANGVSAYGIIMYVGFFYANKVLTE